MGESDEWCENLITSHHKNSLGVLEGLFELQGLVEMLVPFVEIPRDGWWTLQFPFLMFCLQFEFCRGKFILHHHDDLAQHYAIRSFPLGKVESILSFR